MSHVVSIQTDVRDPVAIRAACERLKLPEPVLGKQNCSAVRPQAGRCDYRSGDIRWCVM